MNSDADKWMEEAKAFDDSGDDVRQAANGVFDGGSWVGKGADAAGEAYKEAAAIKYHQADISRVASGLFKRASSDVGMTKRLMAKESDAAHKEIQTFLRSGSGQSLAQVAVILGVHRTAIQGYSSDLQGLSGQHYLEALASGDAHTVLALSAQPPATPQLLTDKALSAQLSATPITDMVVTNTAGQDPQASPDNQQLTLSAKFGPTPSQTAITAHRQDGQWKLETTTVSVTITAPPDAGAAMKTLTVSGVEVNGRNPISVFPGTPQVGSSNRYIDITAPATPLLLEALGHSISSPTITPSIALNDAGRKASLDALDHRLHYCFAGAAPPEGCCPPGGCKRSQSAADPDTENLIALDSSQDMNYQLDPERMRVHLTGTLNYRAEAKSRGQTIPVTSSFTVDSNIDLTTEPPVYIPRGQ
ncbi:hypothetical protein [Mycobacterium avium]|uniref:hypothetical protein n=1 Tax=Mycobacterium avium TaxID=1764 RepID=UPI0003D1DBC6|nr:hypothetical protein [Mycobacterium avium]ETA90038.1 hypothetical protein O984_24300 [Mycobacterium avium 05-4293]ETB17839.1 hypothetical protein O983_26165 [Mycobacterium avium 09-5983]ETZ41187.1 putative methyl-accepting chemotaxis sensory transducer domain protein [Mycobacterium avium MAV_061107_1842]MDV3249194.1 hypothetical protein [Mycobacterium avium subsp. hominissuis]MDV3276158.1 hypothetical protein [Mycobacterium avium subsp. hominissuis]